MIKFKINGQEIEVEEGTTILNAARASTVEIPTFCYQDRLSILASCRMCLIEIEGRPKLEPACATVVSEGMAVLTHSQKVVTSREDMLEILLANHPLDCPVCDKSGECELQDTVFEYGKGDSRLADPKRVFRIDDIELNNVITFNANRCIQCQRCVRVCEEVVGDVALGTMERGLDSEITGVGNSLKDCSHCGNCIEVCPVGALMSTPYRYKARPWDLEKVETTCGMCGTGCSMTIETREGKLARVKSQYETGINGELLCAKGRFGFDFIDGGERITQPMLRKNDVMTPVSWSEALDFIINKTLNILSNNGHIKGLISPRQTNETAFMFQKLMRKVFQSSDIHASCRFSGLNQQPETNDILNNLLTQTYSRQPLAEILKSDCVFILGGNICDENPVSSYLVRQYKRDNHNHLLLASSRPCALDYIATEKLRLLPGNEATLLAALTSDLAVSDDREMADFVSVGKIILEQANSITLLIGTEFMRGKQTKGCLLWIEKTTQRLQQQGKAVFVQFLFDRPNQLGLWHMGCQPDLHNDQSGLQKYHPDNVPDMFYVVGTDPLANCSADDPLEKTALNTPCLIVQTAFMNASAQQATVILPAPSYGEDNGTYTNNEARVQKVRAIRPPAADILPSATVFAQIANSLGVDIGSSKVKQIFSQIKQEIDGYQALKEDFIFGPELNDYGLTATPPTIKASAVTTPVVKALADTAPTVDYLDLENYTLITGDSLFRSGKLTAQSKNLSGLGHNTYVEMNPGADYDEQQDYQVTITRGNVSLTAPLKINRAFPDKLLFIPEEQLCSPANKIITTAEYPCVVEVEIKVSNEANED
ncbi:NADH-quinone oxidoreductase subunit NuoG [Moritella viscosa]|uniref:NADH-quinone oxidoreductase subunit G n=1 Tax=Moritella viscosa TaxID=80854 RepID=A0ABY1HIC3_9GAMM|nr:NADH-quinone oxidoreductase subunit NuoG [Moritella viscosa]SGZ00792.1 NuoG2 NADH I CHAIN G 2 [Moritella viscosa]SGZ16083.1 NuoG2 NADH I CHAIN G 2 [Moritella viscosa]SHO28698.1 NuoG2 NADH I CHAIN G 2 [Moritella viscosa]